LAPSACILVLQLEYTKHTHSSLKRNTREQEHVAVLAFSYVLKAKGGNTFSTCDDPCWLNHGHSVIRLRSIERLWLYSSGDSEVFQVRCPHHSWRTVGIVTHFSSEYLQWIIKR
jgi:hypothetical protein